ncbi:MAG TPA: aminotransferase class V-fold PLP-dependent enzyme, partial [Nitrosomonas sp.]|nr:aminotransferase class V-fold PLP-dependent enzyme [Nitrosomonas sp.]
MPAIYFDHNATTAVDEKVLEAMLPFFRQKYGNASSLHSYGIEARRAINQAREQVAHAVGVQSSQVIFTSGGSEANNLFIRGAADYLKPANIVISAIEHPCVRRPAQELARRSNNPWTLHQLTVNTEGQ